jgi:O-acetyl-ADP-ribose deacetylase (regulator of RNase III)
MKKITGDVLALARKGHFDVIVHGCNCYCDFGAGLAKAIQTSFPQVYYADRATKAGDKSKLGSITYAVVDGDDGHSFTIVNGYTQFHWKGKGVLVDYDAIRSVMQAVKSEFSGQRIGYPKIGAGLARGDWDVISAIIDEVLQGEDHMYVEYEAGSRSSSKTKQSKSRNTKPKSSENASTAKTHS